MKERVADIIFDTLAERGVTECFAVVGGGAMHLDNALGMNKRIHKTFNHHEQACSMAADAYARLSGKMAAVCVTSGPGATNAITGVMGAWQDSLPMIVLSGQVRQAISVEASGLPLRYRGVQEFEIIPSVCNMTKYAQRLHDPLACRREVNKAIDIAMNGRRGPVWLDVPLDIQSAIVETEDLYPNETISPAKTCEESAVRLALEKLIQSKRPVILAGSGIVECNLLDEFRSFAKKTGLPVVGAGISCETMYNDYERFYGQSGILGPRCGNFILQNADVILSLASSLGYQTTGFSQEQFAPQSYIISVDVDENEMKKPGVRVHQFIHGDLHSFLDFAGKLVTEPIPVPTRWIDYCNDLKDSYSSYEPGQNHLETERVCSYRFWEEFDIQAPEDCVMVLGNNSANSSRIQIGVKKEHQRIITNKNCGSMGFDLPAAVGAATTGRQVICFTGDGSIMMNLQEMQTIKHYDLPVKIVVFENDGYNAIRQTSLNFFNGFFVGCTEQSGISFPSFEKVANAFGFTYHCCETNSQIKEAIRWLIQTPGRAFLEVKQLIDDPIIPKVMSRQMPDGTLSTPSLHDLFPFLPLNEMDRRMAIGKE